MEQFNTNTRHRKSSARSLASLLFMNKFMPMGCILYIYNVRHTDARPAKPDWLTELIHELFMTNKTNASCMQNYRAFMQSDNFQNRFLMCAVQRHSAAFE